MILKKYINFLLFIFLLFFSILMIELIMPYFTLQNNVGFLRIKQWIFTSKNNTTSSIWFICFYIHVFTSIFALFAGFTQFNKRFLNTGIHRGFGKLYIFIVLFFASPSGLIIGIFANGGAISKTSFIILALLWWRFTYKAFQHVRLKQYDLHSKFMFKSYALTLSAITLRLWKFIIVNYITELPPMELYQVVSWLSWVPNLIIAEILIAYKYHKKIKT